MTERSQFSIPTVHRLLRSLVLDPFLNAWMQRYLVEVELPALKRLIEQG